VTLGTEPRGGCKENHINGSKEGQTPMCMEESVKSLKVSSTAPVLRFVCCFPYSSVISCLVNSSTSLVFFSLVA